MVLASVTNRVARDLQEDILEVGALGAEVSDVHAMLRNTRNHVRDEMLATAPNGARGRRER